MKATANGVDWSSDRRPEEPAASVTAEGKAGVPASASDEEAGPPSPAPRVQGTAEAVAASQVV